nr:cadherin domain-containing protein [Synechocystis salina]
MSDTAGRLGFESSVDLSFSNTASTSLPNPDSGSITSGTYLPTNDGFGEDTFSEPAPDGPYVASFNDFIATNPNGTWSLYIVDDNGSSAGSLSGGWTIKILTTNLDNIPPIITSGDTATAINENSGAGQVIYQVTATDNGDINADVTFGLKAGDDASSFTIDGTSGEVKLTGNPDFETKPSYKFTVVATDAANNASEKAVTLAIKNLDEVAPTITSGSIAKAINENSGAGQVIYQVTATDDADISTGVTFGLKAGDDASSFTIDPTTGKITLVGNPNFEDKPSYKFTVTASDGVNPATEQLVNLTINNLDEIAPTITSGDTAKAINENSGANQVIYQVTATDDADISAGVTFGLKDADDADLFTIDPATGKVTLIGNPDFETQSSYKFTVTADDGVSSATEQLVTLTIVDLDEIAPTITSGDTATPIDENSGANQIIYQVTADDSKDISAGVTFGLKDADDADLFTIDSATGKVTLIGNPDFETQSSYKFTVTADDGVNVLTEQLVNLTINNLDEIAPTITSEDTATPIDENSGANQVIYQVTADDSADISGGVTFGLKPGDDATSFSIDSTTGKVTLIGNPDFETQSTYKFTVTADDGVNSPTEQLVTLTIVDLDEIAPTITSGNSAKAIAENSGANQIIYQVTADDSADIGAGVTFGLKSGDDADSFTINASTGEVKLIGDPDFETQSSYKFTVTASDGVNAATEQVVNLTIIDLDEIAPTITSGNTAKTIAENSGANQIICQVTADDSADISAGVTFGLKPGDDADSFTINATTGEVKLIGNPDFEAQASYKFIVTADDGVNPATEQLVTLTINDLDEVAPTITSEDTATPIDENSGANQIVYKVTADDSADISGGVTFGLKPGDDATSFSIDSTTGKITLIGNPDFETQSSYKFTVTADDGVNPATEQLVNLTINNIDETAPTITSGSVAKAIAENSGTNQIVYRVTANDSADISAGITFGLKPGDDADLFTISPINGQVILAENPDFETRPSYKFTVTASDGVNPVTEKLISLTINNIDELGPIITSGDTATPIDENSGADQVIYTVTADDSADISGGVIFGFKPGDGADLFTINATTGEVKLIGNPDFETQPSYKFTVTASDGVNPATEQVVNLTIIDLDEIAPTITSGDTATPIDENSGAGQVIYQVTADDSADISGGVTFGLKPGDDATSFSIDSTTGKVKLIGNPDFETQSSYKFTVTASDGVNPATEQLVNLTINNLDEIAPTIKSGDTAKAINENSGAGQVIYQVTADDSADISGGVTFGLKPGDDATSFSIDSTTGKVKLIGNPDFETQSSYKFTVTASDGVNPATEQLVNLTINNLDEVAPIITSGNIAKAIAENSGAGQVIYQVTADDSADISGGVTFGLKPGDDATSFSIDSTTGKVKLIGNPDFETQSSYKFTVTASDSVNSVTEQVVNLAINNLDEVAPIITSGDTATPIDENSGAGQVIYQATADDSADISGGVTFDLKPGDDATSFSIDSTTGKVKLIGNPDFETQSSYKFTVTASDGVNPATEQLVNLAVNNLDEVAPTITSGDTATPIDENSGAGQVIYQATADDSADISGGVTFDLKPGDDATSFSIDSTTGKVKLIGNPDFETQSSYKFTVTASDGVNPATEQLVNLAVNNLDEVAPTITSGDTATPIDENSGAGQVIYQATADDSADISGGVTFDLKPGDDATSFSIDSTTGKVKLIGNPDFETQSSYKFTVTASDGVNSVTEQVVNLTINNLDEVAPTITSGDTATLIDENSGAGQVIYQATADDSADISGGVTFGLKPGDDATSFSIDSTTGKVKLIGNPDFETQSSYKFTVTASDGVNPATEQLVNLTINNLDEVAPIITSGNIAKAIAENSGAGQVIYQVTADDSADISGGVTFGLKPGDDATSFSIDSTTGKVTLIGNPDFETQSSYKFTVTASDGVNPAMEQQITLAITDDNIAVIENGFFFAQFLDGTRQALLFQNQPFSVEQSADWEILDTETIDGLNQVLWYNQATDEVGIWLTDNNWNWISSDTWQVKSSRTFNTELLFGTDINGDFLIGDQYTIVENQGGVSLLQGIFGTYYVQPGDDLVTPIKFLGEPFENQFGSWQALAAERIENINRVLWQNFDTGEIGIWRTDNNWNWISSNVFTPNPVEIATVESLFGISL